MAETVSEPLNNVVLPQQIMATDQVTTTSSCVTTNMDSLQTTADTLNNIRSENMPQEITTTVESISSNETISVSTQVNIIAGHQPETNEYTSQAILHSTALTDKHIAPDTESVSLPPNTIAMSAEGTIVSNSHGELVEILPVSSMPTISTLNPNLPPWAARLRDCELIGDSYRGYVTNEVELDLILTLHKQHTNSCWGTRQSPSSAKPSIRLMWKSQYVPYDGIPFLNTGRRATVMECQYGPRRKGCTNKKNTDFDNQGNTLKKSHRPTCPARIYIKKVKKFPEYRIEMDLNLEGKNVRQAQERALTHLRLAGVESGGEERFYVQLPLPVAHEYHDVEDLNITQSPDNRGGQRLNQQVADKIHELVARGITGVYTIKHCLKEYVEKEMYIGHDTPPRHNKAFFPTIIDLQNHIHEAQSALATGHLLPLPPLNNTPIIPSPTKERARKRKQPTKHSQTSQTINRLQTAEAVASIQDLDDESSSEAREDEKQEDRHHLQEQLAQFNESDNQPLVITHGQTDPTKNGQVVIVVTSNNVFTAGQETETPTSFAQLSLPSSHITNIPSSSFGTLPTGSQAVLITHQQGENGQYLTQHGNILTVVNPALHGMAQNQRVVLRMMSPGNIPTPANIDSQTDPSAPEQLLASQAAVAAVLDAASTEEGIPDQQEQENMNEGEPPLKRQNVGIDLSSLVKEAGFDGHHVQVSGVDMSAEESTTPNTAILTSSDGSSQPYTDGTAETSVVEYSYHNNDNKQSDQAVTVHVHDEDSTQEEVLSNQQSVIGTVDDFEVLDDTQTTDPSQMHHGTVDTRQIHPIQMEAELMNTFPKFTSTSEDSVMHDTIDVTTDVSLISSSQSSTNGEGTHLNSGIVLVTDPQGLNSYQSRTDTSSNCDNNDGLNTKQMSNAD